MRLGEDRIDEHGPNTGWYFGLHDDTVDDAGRHRLTSRLPGETHEVTVRRKVVDAAYLEAPVPATHTPSFEIETGVRLVPVGGIAEVTEPPRTYVVLGAGKTGVDACVWLLHNGVEPDRIRWVRPRDPWLYDRANWQPLDQVAGLMDGLSRELEALAAASSVKDLLERLERCGWLLRIDQDVEPSTFHCATVSRSELEELRQIGDVVRLGRVTRLEPERMVLERGSVPVAPGSLFVDCTAVGLTRKPARSIFAGDRVTVQQVRRCSPTFNAALIAYVEATRRDDAAKNALCRRTPSPTSRQICCAASGRPCPRRRPGAAHPMCWPGWRARGSTSRAAWPTTWTTHA